MIYVAQLIYMLLESFLLINRILFIIVLSLPAHHSTDIWKELFGLLAVNFCRWIKLIIYFIRLPGNMYNMFMYLTCNIYLCNMYYCVHVQHGINNQWKHCKIPCWVEFLAQWLCYAIYQEVQDCVRCNSPNHLLRINRYSSLLQQALLKASSRGIPQYCHHARVIFPRLVQERGR